MHQLISQVFQSSLFMSFDSLFVIKIKVVDEQYKPGYFSKYWVNTVNNILVHM